MQGAGTSKLLKQGSNNVGSKYLHAANLGKKPTRKSKNIQTNAEKNVQQLVRIFETLSRNVGRDSFYVRSVVERGQKRFVNQSPEVMVQQVKQELETYNSELSAMSGARLSRGEAAEQRAINSIRNSRQLLPNNTDPRAQIRELQSKIEDLKIFSAYLDLMYPENHDRKASPIPNKVFVSKDDLFMMPKNPEVAARVSPFVGEIIPFSGKVKDDWGGVATIGNKWVSAEQFNAGKETYDPENRMPKKTPSVMETCLGFINGKLGGK